MASCSDAIRALAFAEGMKLAAAHSVMEAKERERTWRMSHKGQERVNAKIYRRSQRARIARANYERAHGMRHRKVRHRADIGKRRSGGGFDYVGR